MQTQNPNPGDIHGSNPQWSRFAGQYQTFQEFQKERPVSPWRVEEAMFRLLGRGYSQAIRVPV